MLRPPQSPKHPREAIRRPKRYIAREIYQILTPRPDYNRQPLDMHMNISPHTSPDPVNRVFIGPTRPLFY